MAEHTYSITRKDECTLVHHFDVPRDMLDRREVKYPTEASATAAFKRYGERNAMIENKIVFNLSKVTTIAIGPETLDVVFVLENRKKMLSFRQNIATRGKWEACARERKIRCVDNSSCILYATIDMDGKIFELTEHFHKGKKVSRHEHKNYNPVMAKALPVHILAEMADDGSAVLINPEAVVVALSDEAGIMHVTFGNSTTLTIRAETKDFAAFGITIQ